MKCLDAFRLDGRIAVVTGASSGLGEHFAEVLASVGARVVLAARRTDKLTLAHAHHRLAALRRRAVGVLRLDALLHARQVWRQCLALGLAALLLLWSTPACAGAGLQSGELRFQAGLIGRQRLFEDLALLRVHALGLGAELPRLQPRELERDALDLRVAPLDRLRLRVDTLALFANVLALLCDVSQHSRRRLGQFDGTQGLEVLGLHRMHIEHAGIVLPLYLRGYQDIFQLP